MYITFNSSEDVLQSRKTLFRFVVICVVVHAWAHAYKLMKLDNVDDLTLLLRSVKAAVQLARLQLLIEFLVRSLIQAKSHKIWPIDFAVRLQEGYEWRRSTSPSGDFWEM